jgi:hypothetical protein
VGGGGGGIQELGTVSTLLRESKDVKFWEHAKFERVGPFLPLPPQHNSGLEGHIS